MHVSVRSIVALIGIALAGIVFFVGSSRVAPSPTRPLYTPHAFGVPADSIREIHITAVYFVPRDKVPRPKHEWQGLLNTNLTRLQKFHAVQFREQSHITYTLYPEVVQGVGDHTHYDINVAQHTNPNLFQPIQKELAAVVPLEVVDKSFYPVLMVLYEGEGAGGIRHMGLVSRGFFVEEDTAPVASTFLAHEFYHTLGIPDGYHSVETVFPDGTVAESEVLVSRDIMGRVRVPLQDAYLAPDTISAMGL